MNGCAIASRLHQGTLAPMWAALLVLTGLCSLQGCASLGLAPAQTFEQQLAYAYGTHTAVLEAASTAVAAGTLSKPDGAQVLSLADQARSLLDGARAAYVATDQNTAQSKLSLAVTLLTQLQTYLHSRGIK